MSESSTPYKRHQSPDFQSVREGLSEHEAEYGVNPDAWDALQRIEEQYEEAKDLLEVEKLKHEVTRGHESRLRAERNGLLEQKEALRTAVLARCFMCADGIARQDCEPFDMHNYTVSGLHSWRGNDRMFCGLTQQEAEAAGVSNPASEPKP